MASFPWHRFSLKWRLTLANFMVPMLTMTLAIAFAIHIIDGFIFRQAQNKIINDLNSAREIYDSSCKCLQEQIHCAAGSYLLTQALLADNKPALLRELQALRRRENLSLLTLTDAEGRVLLRAANPGVGGDQPRLPLIAETLLGNPAAGSEVLSDVELSLENPNLGHLFQIKLISTPKARQESRSHLAGGLMMLAGWPVYDGFGNLIGALYGGRLLNRENQLVDRIKEVIFSNTSFSGQDIGTVTIFQEDVRIATNVLDSSGKRAIGTRVSEEVYHKVMIQGQKWADRAFVVNDWYISAYEPICNARNQVVGILYVGMKEKPFLAFRNRVILILVGILTAGAALTFLTVFIFARFFSRRLDSLQQQLSQVAGGQLKSRLELPGNDELSQLAAGFNEMIAVLKQRDASIEQLQRGLENKVAQRTQELETRNHELIEMKQHLLEMMSDKKAINFRLEESLHNLQQAQQQLVRSGKLAALGSLVAGVAHEINNPVNIIAGNLEILEMDPDVQGRYRTEIELISGQAARIKKIIGNMLGFARVRNNHLKELRADELIRDLLIPLRNELNQRGISVTTQPQTEAPFFSDEEGLTQIITNLLCNSMQAIPETGGRIGISSRVDRGKIEITISDNGCGMTPEQVENMFNPFYSTKSEGTGLGLSIGYELLRSLGGDIEVDSSPGQGTTIILVLPANPLFPFDRK
ncbi:MAG TPA: HAMP domain-containing protein [Proteobacteria bacterium]|nr:HAMP domain-containing protein [Pseudomonadota bacterium]